MALGKVLLIDDDTDLTQLLAHELSVAGCHVRTAATAERGHALLRDGEFDVVVTDLDLVETTGVDFCRRVRERHETVPVILMTAHASTEAAIAAIRAGAYDFITKPFSPDAFVLCVKRALELESLRREAASLRLRGSASIAERIFGHSGVMQRLRDLVSLVADGNSNVLVRGESGTGKELVARALHDLGPRSSGPFVAINCAAMPESLLESELFGHTRGAFTDARTARTGLFVRATGGTLFLDEIGEMPPTMQVKLLRALQERRVRPVGADEEVSFDARVIAATHQDLKKLIDARAFREDLYYRLAVIEIAVPPLRARNGDIIDLAERFLRELSIQTRREALPLSADVRRAFGCYSWPGNVRQLHNCIERALAIASGPEITLEELPDDVRTAEQAPPEPTPDPAALDMPSWDEVERRYIRHVLGTVAGNRSLAARILGFDRRTLQRKLQHAGTLPS